MVQCREETQWLIRKSRLRRHNRCRRHSQYQIRNRRHNRYRFHQRSRCLFHNRNRCLFQSHNLRPSLHHSRCQRPILRDPLQGRARVGNAADVKDFLTCRSQPETSPARARIRVCRRGSKSRRRARHGCLCGARPRFRRSCRRQDRWRWLLYLAR